MTLHFVLDPAGSAEPLAAGVLTIAALLRQAGHDLVLYAAPSEQARPPDYRPIEELAFVEDPTHLLLWCYGSEAPSIHLAERFPGIRVLLCGKQLADGELNHTLRGPFQQLLSLARSFERVYAESAPVLTVLSGLGFDRVMLWPGDASIGQTLSATQLFSEWCGLPRLPRTADSAAVSIVICTLNRAEHLESCLLQLRRQCYPRFEVIVVNGPSTDGTEEVLRRFAGEIKVRRNPHPNLCISRNLGIAAAAGDIVAFLDDDSFAHPHWLREALPAFDDPLTAAVGGLSYRLRDEAVEFSNGLLTDFAYPWPIQPAPGSHHDGANGLWNTATGNNCLFRRDALLQVGGFDERFPYAHDESNVVMRMARQGLRTRHRPLAVVHHGSQPGLNRRSEFDLNWVVIVRDSIYCGVRIRPAGAHLLPHLLRTLWEHARHRLYDPIDWWLYRRIRFGEFLSIQRKCFQGLLAGAFKALFVAPQPISASAVDTGAEPFLRYPAEQANPPHTLVQSSSHAPFRDRNGEGLRTRVLAEALRRDGFAACIVTNGAKALLDSRCGVFYHSVPPSAEPLPEAFSTLPKSKRQLQRAIAVWRTMQELAVRRGAWLLASGICEGESLIAACDPRFHTIAVISTSMHQTKRIEGQPGNEDLQMALDFERVTLRSADALVGLGEAVAAEVLREHGLSADRLQVIPVGLPDRAPRAEEPAPTPHLLFLGPFSRRTGASVFLEAIPHILLEYPEVRVDFAGELPADAASPERRLWDNWLRIHPLEAKRVVHHGPVSEAQKDRLLRQCRMLVMPSLHESFGIPAVEAMMFGRPVVSTTAGGIPELVSAEVTGILVPAGEPRALANAVLRLLRDEVVWNRMAIAARQRYEARFTEAAMARAFRGLVLELDAARQHHSPLAGAAEAPVFQGTPGVTRWRDPLYHRDFQELPACGTESVSACWEGPFTPGPYRLDVFVGLSESTRAQDPVCECGLKDASGSAVMHAVFRGSAFGDSRWAILSRPFSIGAPAGSLRFVLRNTGFTALRLQRVEIRRLQN